MHPHGRNEAIFLGHDNRIDLILKVKQTGGSWAALDLAAAGADRMTLAVGGEIVVDSANLTDGDPITWAWPGYVPGETRIQVGVSGGVPAGAYTQENPLYLVVYSPSQFPSGIVWPPIPCVVLAEVAAEP